MAPPCQQFPPSSLPHQVQLDTQGKKRKTDPAGKVIDLAADCNLLQMSQYDCRVDHPERRDSPVRCYEVVRWFRR